MSYGSNDEKQRVVPVLFVTTNEDPQLKPGQVVVLDNASFHKSTLIGELIEQAGCKLLFLPQGFTTEKDVRQVTYQIQKFTQCATLYDDFPS